MPSIDGGDQLSAEYAPWAYIGPDNEHFVWQTEQTAEHDGYFYRIGMTNDTRVVCERRPLEDMGSHGSYLKRDRVEAVPLDQIPEGLFPNLSTMTDKVREIGRLVNMIDPSLSASDQLEAKIQDKQKQAEE